MELFKELILLILVASMLISSTEMSSKKTFPGIHSRIIGGADADDGEWPWQVSVQYKGYHICGGTLISNQWVISAAHCFRNPDPSAFMIYLGIYQLENPSPHQINVTIEKIIIYPETNESKGDIVLLKLSRPVTLSSYIQTVRLPDESSVFPCGMDCWTTGWGKTEDSWTPPNGTLQEVSVPLIDSTTCDKMYHVMSTANASTVLIHDYEICAGFIDGGKTPCYGDDGGPLVCSVLGAWYQVGLGSRGYGCGYPYRPFVFVSVPKYQQWIQQYVTDVRFTALKNIPKPNRECLDLNFNTTSAFSPLRPQQGIWLLLSHSVILCLVAGHFLLELK